MMNPRSVQTENGSTNVMYVTITPVKARSPGGTGSGRRKSGMISPACGSIWMPIIRTMKTLRPVKRNFASATAARKASTIESATVTLTMIRLFSTSFQKNGRSIASRKCSSVGCSGSHVGVSRLIWSSA